MKTKIIILKWNESIINGFCTVFVFVFHDFSKISNGIEYLDF